MGEGMTIGALLAESDDILKGAGVDSPRLSSQVLAMHSLGLDRVRLVLDRERVLAQEEVEAVRALVARRAAGEPVAYLTGEKEFFGLDFAVSAHVLVPRPETEHLIEAVQARFAADAPLAFADLGTGSGCIAVTLAHLFPAARGLALDRSPRALAQARDNARSHGVDARLLFVRADMGAPFARAGSLDLVAANPPYVSEAEFAGISREVAAFEPRTALVPGVDGVSDGLECYAALLPGAVSALAPGGWLILEIGETQAESVFQLVENSGGFHAPDVLPDLAGRDRIVVAKRV